MNSQIFSNHKLQSIYIHYVGPYIKMQYTSLNAFRSVDVDSKDLLHNLAVFYYAVQCRNCERSDWRLRDLLHHVTILSPVEKYRLAVRHAEDR